jgi:hypothetical protein
MKTRRDVQKSLLVAAGLVALTAFVADARPGQGRGPGTPIYDPKTETTITGVIQELKEVPGPGRGAGTHLVVRQEARSTKFMLGQAGIWRSRSMRSQKATQ